MAGQARSDVERRFGGLARLYGVQGAARIRDAHVAVVGIGGVGSWAAEALARSGVGRLTLIDLDHVAESNVNRQIHALTDTLGQAKVQAMRERIAQIHPGCEVHAVEEFVEAANWPQLLPEPVDAVIDACDQMAAKVTLAAWARGSGTRFITVGAAGGKRYAERVEIADIADVTHDPLIAQLRYRLRRHHGAATGGQHIGIAAIFSRENVRLPEACDTESAVDGSLNCHGYGSSVAVTATFGMCAAGWLVDQLANTGVKNRAII
ncbi:tRNA threonylcarbamoyladenosine dehydratase [Ottowia testudinis]|uniref:tRNA threonylcarbamoyladenosine dehydratase n=1 Tax=Ottowia testudinis TaxID=2816950 RepID=A0A975H505_9BURK|nr:tRNA threonylcarbamoyladenosine dehydratase [Ottowia testudinis]QTD47404.1 tRNA threonylcarbamoyladenosine dehydratase [Ottowia testudinis]